MTQEAEIVRLHALLSEKEQMLAEKEHIILEKENIISEGSYHF